MEELTQVDDRCKQSNVNSSDSQINYLGDDYETSGEPEILREVSK